MVKILGEKNFQIEDILVLLLARKNIKHKKGEIIKIIT